MSLSLATLKLGLGASLSAGTVGVLTYGTYNILINPPKTQKTTNNLIVVSSTPSTTPGSLPALTDNGQEKNYKCKISNSEQITTTCKLVKLDIQNNWIDLAGIKKAKQTASLSATDLNTAGNYFKLEVDKAFFGKIDFENAKTIDIVSTDDKASKYASLDTLFKVDSGAVTYGKTDYLLGKSVTGAAAVASNKPYECVFTDVRTPDTTKSCTFHAFGTTTASLSGAGYSNQKPTSLPGTAVNATLTANNNYLIKYANKLNQSDIDNNTNVYINSVETTPTAYVASGSFKNVVPVIINGTGSSQTAFILSETPTFSVVVKKVTEVTASKSVTHNQTNKNYKCKLSTGDAFNCTLVPLEFSSSQTWLDKAAVDAAQLTADLPQIPSSGTNAYYKLEVPADKFSDFGTTTLAGKTIQIVEFTGDTEKAVLFTLDPLFSIEDDVIHYDQSTFIVKGATIASTGPTLDNTKTHWCSFSADENEGTSSKKCTLKELGTTLAAATTLSPTTAPTTIDTSKTYLVTFTEQADAKGVAKASNSTKNLVFFEETTSPNKKQIAKFAPENVDAAIVVEGSNAAKHAFVLK